MHVIFFANKCNSHFNKLNQTINEEVDAKQNLDVLSTCNTEHGLSFIVINTSIKSLWFLQSNKTARLTST